MSKKKSSLKKWIFIAIFLIAASAIGVVGLRSGDKGIEVTVKAIKRGDITSVVTATGKIQPEVEVVISSEVPGEIIELPVKDGDSIAKGDLLVRVNPDTLEAQVKQQEAGLASTRASSAQQRAQLLQAELDFKRTEDLFAKGFATKDEREQAKTRLEIARAAHESSLFQVERQEMQLKEATDQLAKASLFSPISGTVVRLNSELGDRVVGTGQFAGTEIMRVADLSNMEVQVDVSEADIVNIEIGDSATVEIDALPDETIAGTVTEIANSALTSNERSQEQLTTFAVRIRLNDPNQRLRPGMTATADIETDTVTDVVKASTMLPSAPRVELTAPAARWNRVRPMSPLRNRRMRPKRKRKPNPTATKRTTGFGWFSSPMGARPACARSKPASRTATSLKSNPAWKRMRRSSPAATGPSPVS